MEVAVQPVTTDFDLIAWFVERGHAVVPAPVRRDHLRPAPWGPFTCVEVVKRVLGLHDRWVVTPWQLYRRLSGRLQPRSVASSLNLIPYA